MGTTSYYLSPLRYPGGKGDIANYIKLLVHINGLRDGDYFEPYAGGAGVALGLLFGEHVRHIHINDVDKAIYAFWKSVLDHTDELCRLIQDTSVTIEEWHTQKAVQTQQADVSLLELGFSTFFLNRCNRSGIISGGVIGGKAQSGDWKIDARFNKQDLIARIQQIANRRSRIFLYNKDAIELLRTLAPELPSKSLIYLDPPYYRKGKELYTNFYTPDDHADVAHEVKLLSNAWIVSYDNCPEIVSLYEGMKKIEYKLSYSANGRYQGSEVMFFSDRVKIPDVPDPRSKKIQYAYTKLLL